MGKRQSGSHVIDDDTASKIDKAIAKQRAELQSKSVVETRQEFEFTFGIRPELNAGKENLVDRILAKARAELERNP